MFICDGCYAHVKESIMDVLSTNNIVLKLLPPHTSHLLQPLDVVMFGSLKNTEIKLKKISKDDTVNCLNELYNKIQISFHSSNILSSFHEVGICHRCEGFGSERKSYFAIDTTKIGKENHDKMENILKDLTCSIENQPEYIYL